MVLLCTMMKAPIDIYRSYFSSFASICHVLGIIKDTGPHYKGPYVNCYDQKGDASMIDRLLRLNQFDQQQNYHDQIQLLRQQQQMVAIHSLAMCIP
jgi:hypothetical protein